MHNSNEFSSRKTELKVRTLQGNSFAKQERKGKEDNCSNMALVEGTCERHNLVSLKAAYSSEQVTQRKPKLGHQT